eukprot:scaffold720_cov114-Cylindrotheca_fusiformis.AAC.6
MASGGAYHLYLMAAIITITSGLIHLESGYRCSQLKSLHSDPFEDDSSIRPWSSIVTRDELFAKWGVTKEDNYRDFPATIEEVIEHAFNAIAGTIYGKCAMDPGIASNARSTSIFTNRPVRSRNDAGRIGIEMDGLRCLFPRETTMSPGQSVRRAALMLAGKLSMDDSWKSFEHKKAEGATLSTTRPVVVYLNSVKEALWASAELQELKRTDINCIYDNVRLMCLSDEIPRDMLMDRKKRRRWRGLSTGFVNATRGCVVLVQPTDYNSEHAPPGPAVENINCFQGILAQASVEEIPIIAFSPRYLNNDSPLEVKRDQSGYQQSAVYGGVEPPKGPTPWVMRDFTPPVFCWIGNAAQIGKLPKEGCKVTRIALSQSAMEEGHLWHMFAARECTQSHKKTPTVEYHYLASSSSASGRPTRALARKVLENFGECMSNRDIHK